MCKITSGVFILLMLVTQQCMAVDESIFYGKWKNVECNNLLSLTLSKKTAFIKMKDKKMDQEIKHEYVYSNISPYPFLSIMFTDKNNNEHLLYAVIGMDAKSNKWKMTGFYEKSKILSDSHGKLESISEKIEFIKSE